MTEFEKLITEPQQLFLLDFSLKAMRTLWWGTHKISITEWMQCKWLLEVQFEDEVETMAQRYTGLLDPAEHLDQCSTAFSNYPC